jgi:FtsP/CotA-like multicopper oxidase with cupredoxin domain
MNTKYITRVSIAALLFTTPLVSVASVDDKELRNPVEWKELHPDKPLEVELVVEQKFDQIQTSDGKICQMTRRAYNKKGNEPTYEDRVGPTIRVQPSDTLKVTLRNALDPTPCGISPNKKWALSEKDWPYDVVKCDKDRATDKCSPDSCQPLAIMQKMSNITNLHTHGWHVSPGNNENGTPSDNVFIKVKAGENKDYEYYLQEHASGTFWYHAHVHGSTAVQVGYGLAGALIVEGGSKDISNIPEIGAAEEKLFVFQQMDCDDGDSVTLINGQYQPIITMQPGEVQRWRLIHAGAIQTIMLGIRPKPPAKDEIKFHEIAVDGLTLREMKENKKQLELQPGYRSDVLIKMPVSSSQGTEYELYDMETSATVSLNEIIEPYSLLATVKVSGELENMKLPNPDLKDWEPHPPITNDELDGTQLVTFNKAYATCVLETGVCTLDENEKKFQYMISQSKEGEEEEYYIFPHIDDDPDLDSFPPHRILTKDKAQKWLLDSVRGHHPYHIHVNPFQHILEKDDDGEPTDWIWRDTLLVTPENSQTPIEIRTRYERYKGAFVMHCHNLEHEDLGMMECIKIVDPTESNSNGEVKCENP